MSSTFYYCVKSIHVALTFELKSFCCGLLGNWSLIGLQPHSDTSPSHFSLTSMHTAVYMPRHVIRIKFTEVNGILSSKDLFLWHSGYKKTHKKSRNTQFSPQLQPLCQTRSPGSKSVSEFQTLRKLGLFPFPTIGEKQIHGK